MCKVGTLLRATRSLEAVTATKQALVEAAGVEPASLVLETRLSHLSTPPIKAFCRTAVLVHRTAVHFVFYQLRSL